MASLLKSKREIIWEQVCRVLPSESVLSDLDERDLNILYYRYIKGMSFSETGRQKGVSVRSEDKQGVTRAYVRQREMLALSRIRRAFWKFGKPKENALSLYDLIQK